MTLAVPSPRKSHAVESTYYLSVGKDGGSGSTATGNLTGGAAIQDLHVGVATARLTTQTASMSRWSESAGSEWEGRGADGFGAFHKLRRGRAVTPDRTCRTFGQRRDHPHGGTGVVAVLSGSFLVWCPSCLRYFEDGGTCPLCGIVSESLRRVLPCSTRWRMDHECSWFRSWPHA